MRRGPGIVLLLLLLIGLSYGAGQALRVGSQRLNSFRPVAFTAPVLPPGPTGLTKRLVLILADGLQPEDALRLPTWDLIHRRGASLRLTMPAPSSHPQVAATLLTGTSPTRHGIMLPTPEPLLADHLAAAAGRGGLRVGGAGDQALGILLGQTAAWEVAADTASLLTAASSLLAPTGPQLVILQVDTLHGQAGADGSPLSHDELLAQLDLDLVRILEQIDLTTTAVAVTGAIPAAPNGSLPTKSQASMVLAGPGIRAGYTGEAHLTDIAPTLTALLGVPTPMHAQGHPALEALNLEGRPADAVAGQYLKARKVLTELTLQELGSSQAVPDAPESAAEITAYTESLERMISSAWWEQWKSGVLQRLPYAAAGLLLILAYLFLVYRQPFGGVLILTTLAYGLMFYGGFFLIGGQFAAAIVGLQGLDWGVVLHVGLLTIAAIALSSVLGGYLLSRRGFRKKAYLTGASLHLLLSTAVVLCLPTAVTAVFLGWDFTPDLPSPSLLGWFFITGVQTILIGYLSPLWTVLVVASARIAEKAWPIQEIGDPERNADKVVRLRAIRKSVRGRI